jgi:ADP-ribosyl-[dinitrogen reductase] hydrolase
MPPPKKKKGLPPVAADAETQRTRAKGALLGLVVGEALGAPFVGRNFYAPEFPKLADGPYVDMHADGPFERRAGQMGAGALQAAALAGVLRTQRRVDCNAAARAYVRLRDVYFQLPPTLLPALELVSEGRTALFSGRQAYYESAEKSLDAWPLLRAVPLGVALRNQPQRRVDATLEDAGITHFSALPRVAAAALNGVISIALTTPLERVDTPTCLRRIETEVALAAATLGRMEPDIVQQAKTAFEQLREDADFAQRGDPRLYGPELNILGATPNARVAWRLGLWSLFHAPSFEAGLLDIVNRGGEASINAGVAGALLGAAFGEHAIPERWSAQVFRVGHQIEDSGAREFDLNGLLMLSETEMETEGQAQ